MDVIRRAFAHALFASLAAGAFGGFLNSAAAEPITLRVHTFNSPKAIAVRLFLRPWAREVEKRAGGRVKVEV
ncbi:MAG: C4-dicarboxylate ABC transporter, partial [Rhodospirillaceae bacterium]|nr:C4-dicarboxylate ABC transporter [Rhodospirillaceae bacterium]